MVVDGPLCAQDNVARNGPGGFAYVAAGANSLLFNNPSTTNIANNLQDDIFLDDDPSAIVSSMGVGRWPPGLYNISGPVSSAELSNGILSFAGCGTKAKWNSELCQCKVTCMHGLIDDIECVIAEN